MIEFLSLENQKIINKASERLGITEEILVDYLVTKTLQAIKEIKEGK
jgi:hypothetical protein